MILKTLQDERGSVREAQQPPTKIMTWKHFNNATLLVCNLYVCVCVPYCYTVQPHRRETPQNKEQNNFPDKILHGTVCLHGLSHGNLNNAQHTLLGIYKC